MLEDYRSLHVNNVVKELNNSSFAAAFGDVKLVFANGEVIPYFKSLLSITSLDWKLLLQLRPDMEVVLLPDFSVTEFFRGAVVNDLEDIFQYDHEDFTTQENEDLTSYQSDHNDFMSEFETETKKYVLNEFQNLLTKDTVKEQGNFYCDADDLENNGPGSNNESKKGEGNLGDQDFVELEEGEEYFTWPVNEVTEVTNEHIPKDKEFVAIYKDDKTVPDFDIEITEFNKSRERGGGILGKEDILTFDEEAEPVFVEVTKLDEETLKVEEILTYEEFVAQAEEPIPGPVVDLQGYTGPIFLQGIQGDFKWPPHLTGPPSHVMGWRKSPGSAGDAVTVRGNRSISRVLEDAGALGQQAAFLLQCQSEEEQLGGVLHLKELADGQAASSCPAFQLQGKEDWLSLKELVALAGYSPESFLALGDPYYNRKPGGMTMAARVLLYMGEKMTNLQELTHQWKQVLLKDSIRLKEEQEKINKQGLGQKPGKAKFILEWLKIKCVKTTDNGTVCLYCGLICYEQSISHYFMKHMKKHLFRRGDRRQIRKRQQCNKCNKTFKDTKPLKLHMVFVHNMSPNELVRLKECPFCKVIIPLAEMNRHRITTHLNDKLECKDCQLSFLNEKLLGSHWRNVHNTKYNFKGICSLCQKEVPNIKNHMKNGHIPVQCTHCDKIFSTQRGLTAHMHSVNGTMPKRQCPECFKYIIDLKEHIMIVHRGEMKPSKRNKWRCSGCMKFVLKVEYDVHKQICKPHICSICFKPVQALEQHLLKAHSEGLKCVLCAESETFRGKNHQSQKGELRDHIYETHMKDMFLELGITQNLNTKDEKCREDITQYFVDRKSAREGEIHTCQICLNVFDRGSKIFNHMKYHLKYLLLGKHTFSPCPGCGKKVSRNKLKEHVCSEPKTSAAKLKHVCQECGKLFGEKYRLKRHMTIHTKIKDAINKPQFELGGPTQPSLTQSEQQTLTTTQSQMETNLEHICQQCGSCFNQNYELKIHMKIHARQKEEPGTKKGVKCSCSGCTLKSCGECQTCKNKNMKKRCIKRRCVA